MTAESTERIPDPRDFSIPNTELFPPDSLLEQFIAPVPLDSWRTSIRRGDRLSPERLIGFETSLPADADFPDGLILHFGRYEQSGSALPSGGDASEAEESDAKSPSQYKNFNSRTYRPLGIRLYRPNDQEPLETIQLPMNSVPIRKYDNDRIKSDRATAIYAEGLYGKIAGAVSEREQRERSDSRIAARTRLFTAIHNHPQ